MNNRYPLDDVLKDAVDVARVALEPIAQENEVGDYIGVEAEGERLVTHSFACHKPGYTGWRWVATLARIPRGRKATVCEIDLLPGEDALLAPQWIPWAKRLSQEEIDQNREIPSQPERPRLASKRRRRRLRRSYSNTGYVLSLAQSMDTVHHLRSYG